MIVIFGLTGMATLRGREIVRVCGSRDGRVS